MATTAVLCIESIEEDRSTGEDARPFYHLLEPYQPTLKEAAGPSLAACYDSMAQMCSHTSLGREGAVRTYAAAVMYCSLVVIHRRLTGFGVIPQPEVTPTSIHPDYAIYTTSRPTTPPATSTTSPVLKLWMQSTSAGATLTSWVYPVWFGGVLNGRLVRRSDPDMEVHHIKGLYFPCGFKPESFF